MSRPPPPDLTEDPAQERIAAQAPAGMPSRVEFIALMAMLSATIAFSIDAMMPALPYLAATFVPDNPNAAQLVITSFVLGMGLGTMLTGPLSDRFGRKPVMLLGTALYVVAALAAKLAQSLEALLVARMVQGLGAAGPRVVALAVIRDLFAGRGMAQIISFVMMVFALVPTVAPLVGALILAVANWQAIFLAFVLFGIASALWLMLRLPETLPPERRRPFRAKLLWAAVQEMFAHPMVRQAIYVQSICFAILFACISSIQPIYDVSFGRAESFPYWFGLTALLSASSGYLNARLVVRLGMRRLVSGMLLVQILSGAALTAVILGGLQGDPLFVAFLIWQQVQFFQAGLTLGNLNAIAMEPMGHIAGMAASVIGSCATVVGAALAVPVGLLFDGTPLPLSFSVLLFSVLGYWLMRRLQRSEAGPPGT